MLRLGFQQSRRLLLAAALLGAAGCRRHRELDAPPPAFVGGTDTLPALPPSLVDVPVSYDLTPVIATLESAIPRSFGDLSVRSAVPGNTRAHYAFAAERGPFHVSFDGTVAHISTVVQY